MKSLFLLSLLPLLATGCGVTVHNMTPKKMVRNPSGLYTIAVEVTRKSNSVLDGTVQPILVLPDQSVPMMSTPKVRNRWEYTVAVPANVNQCPYYFRVNYMVEKNVIQNESRSITNPTNAPAYQYVLRIDDQVPIGLSSRRGRVGSEIKVLGKSFVQGNRVTFDGKEIATVYEADTTLSFRIPAVEANKAYPVGVNTSKGTLNYGEVLVDESQFLVSSSLTSIDLAGEGSVEIAIPQPAPAGGLPVQLASSDPDLLAVPATATIPEGQSRILVIAKAKHMGTGTISLRAPGFTPGSLPFTVTLVKSK